MAPVRALVLWCPDWPVAAADLVAGVPATDPVAVLAGNRVLACSAAARAAGVRRGLTRREAQNRCPELVTVAHDPARDAVAFETVLTVVEEATPGVELIRPGLAALPVRGLARHLGGEERAAEHLVEQIACACGVEAQVGIADGVFAATRAARLGRIVPPGESPRFLAGLPIGALGRPALTDLLRRLGLRTLGDFAALPAGDVLARFGVDGALAHRAAAGREHRAPVVRRPPPEVSVEQTYDEPLERVDVAAFAARALAERLRDRLAGHGLGCTRLGIEAVTADGGELHRYWRHDGLLDDAAIAERLRWQLDGWLSGGGRHAPARPGAGIIRLRLIPDGLLAAGAQQTALWGPGSVGAERDRAHRALNRLQGILGPEAVLTAVPGGGRDPADRIRLVPWGDERVPARPPDPPWPGRLPAPSPAVVLPTPIPAEVYDAAGRPVTVTARLAVSGAPTRLVVTAPPGGPAAEAVIDGWAGPWPVDERWWDPQGARRRARFQVRLTDGTALLLTLGAGRWAVEAVYD